MILVRITINDIADHLKMIADKENVKTEYQALLVYSRKS